MLVLLSTSPIRCGIRQATVPSFCPVSVSPGTSCLYMVSTLAPGLPVMASLWTVHSVVMMFPSAAIYAVCLLFYFWPRWVFIAVCGLSLVAMRGGYSSLWCAVFSLWWLLLLQSMGSSCVGLVAPRHMGSSQTGDRTRVPCIGRRILNHCTTREVPRHVS